MSSNKDEVPFLYYSKYEGGHRADYMRFVEKEYGACRIVSKWRLLISREPVLFLMAEEGPLFVIFAMLFRRIFAARTVALLFRLRPLIDGAGVGGCIKRLVLKLIKKSNSFGFVSIIPEQILPEVSELCRYSIYDFQFWDCLGHEYNVSSRDEYGLAILGKQDVDKGFNYIPEFLSNFGEMKNLTVRGRVDSGCEEYLLQILKERPAADVHNRFVSDDEIFDAYLSYRYIWCCYSPDYDQSSGILGRAIQFGNVPIVRLGSVSELYCKVLAGEYLVVGVEDGGVICHLSYGRADHDALRLASDSFFKMVVSG